MLRQDPLFVSSVQSHLTALRSLLYGDKDIQPLSDHDVRRRLEFVDFEAIIPRKILHKKPHCAIQLRASRGQYDSLANPFQKNSNVNGKLPLLSSKSGTRLLHLAYVGTSPSKSVKHREKGLNSANSGHNSDSNRDLCDVSNSARGLIVSVLDEVLQMSVDEVVMLDNSSDSKAVIPLCGSDTNSELSNSARDWTRNLINDVMQNALMNSRFAVDDESSSDDCDKNMTASAREAVISFVHDVLCFCMEDTQNYLDLDVIDNVTAAQPCSSQNPMQKQKCGDIVQAAHEPLPAIADDKRVVQLFRVSTSEKPSVSRQAFLNSVQDNLDSLRSILYQGNRFSVKKGNFDPVMKCPITQLELNSIIPSWIGQTDGTNFSRKISYNGQKNSNVISGNRELPALKYGITGVQKYKQSTVSASRIVHNQPSNLLPQSRPAIIHSESEQSRCHDSRHAKKSNDGGASIESKSLKHPDICDKKQISRRIAPVRLLPKVSTSADNRKSLHFNSRDKK